MNNTEPKTTPLKNSEEHEKLVLDLKQDIQNALHEAKKWQGSYIKIEQALAEEERKTRTLEAEKESLKLENAKQRRIELESKETKQKNDTLDLFTQKFQAKMEAAK